MKRSAATVKRWSLVVGSLGVAASLVLTPTVLASTAKAKTCKSGAGTTVSGAAACSGLSFYSRKTIHLIISTGTANIGEDIASAMGAYLRGTVDVVPVGPGNVTAENEAAAAAPNGLTIGNQNTGQVINTAVSGTPSVDFNIRDEVDLGGIPTEDLVIVGKPGSAYTSFNAILKSKSSVTVLDQSTAGITNMTTRIIFGVLGVPTSFLTSYISPSLIESGFLRGDGPIAPLTTEYAVPLIFGNQAVPLLQTYLPPDGIGSQKLRGVPSFAKYLAEHAPKTAAARAGAKELLAMTAENVSGSVFFAPAGTPADLSTALANALSYAFSRPGVKKLELEQYQPTGYMSGRTANAQLANELKHRSSLDPYVPKAA